MDKKKTTSKPLTAFLLKGVKALGVLAVAITALGGLDAILTNRLELGQFIGESQVSVQLAEAKGSIAKLQIELNNQKDLTKSQADKIRLLQNENWDKQRKLSLYSKQTDLLRNSVGKIDNCTFIYQKIRKTEQNIDNLVPTSLSFSEGKAEVRAKKVTLESRLRGYQQQLGTCRS